MPEIILTYVNMFIRLQSQMNALQISDSGLNKAATLLKAVAHPTRLKIICLLGTVKKMSVSEISNKTDCEQSLISHHLINMRNKGLLKLERDGKNIYYSLAERNILGVVKCINNCKKN